MTGQVPEEVKAVRSQSLQAMNEKNREAYIRRFIGRKLEVLFEEPVRVDGRMWWSGYSREYIRVLYASDEALSNHIREMHGVEVLCGVYLVVSDRG